jgi:UDP-N-acetylmuramoyl-tripeptide--D-alanyl-D-alanine ligase
MKPLWTLPEIAAALHVEAINLPHTPVTGVSIDTRTIKPGDLFVALSGTPSGGFKSSFESTGDGHAYLAQAAEKGAVAAIVAHKNDAVNIPQFVVGDTLMDGLWALGRAARSRFTGTLIALTGSAGKTSTKEMLATLLQCPASVGSYNNFWGVPLTLARIPSNAEYAVVEMGMNQKGEIARLSALARPHVALVVNVHPVHLEHLGSLDAIRHEKLSITVGLESGGSLVVPSDLSLEGCNWHGRVVTFSDDFDMAKPADVHVYSETPEGTTWHIEASVVGRKFRFRLPEGAPHRLHNAMAALATVHAAIGINADMVADRMETIGTLEGRGTVQIFGGVTVIDDSFNGNPASMRAALESLSVRPVVGRRIAVLGDMLELGPDAPRYHAELAAFCQKIDRVVAIGSLMGNLWEALPAEKRMLRIEDPEDFEVEHFATMLQPQDAVVVKGSKKMLYMHHVAERLRDALAGRD